MLLGRLSRALDQQPRTRRPSGKHRESSTLELAAEHGRRGAFVSCRVWLRFAYNGTGRRVVKDGPHIQDYLPWTPSMNVAIDDQIDRSGLVIDRYRSTGSSDRSIDIDIESINRIDQIDWSIDFEAWANIETRMQNEKKTALEKLEKEKNDAYNSLKESYESLKKQLGDMIATDATLATDSKRLVAEKISLTTQLQDKTSAYNSLEADLKRDHEKTLSAKETAWTTERTTLNGQINKVTNERSLADAKISKLKDTMLWAGLYENSRMDNCLPSSFSGWTVMIMMPHSRMALNANNDHHDMAHAWSFNMWNDDEVFKLAKANNHPDTPWTITNLASGKLLVFLNGETDWQVRCRERNDPRLVGRSAYWYIGRGAADFNTTWVLKNAEWGTCIQLERGWAENGRQAKSFQCTNAGDANWVIIPLNL
ncbi:hypothetical protein V3481_016426 [Fusarium oxysporum f. sp. vasinfectum]